MPLPFYDASVMLGQTIAPLPTPILSTSELLAEMDRFGIRRSLFFEYTLSAEPKDDMNRRTLAAAKASPRLAPCWMLATSFEDLNQDFGAEAERLLKAGCRAARIFPDEGPAAGTLPLRPYLLEPALRGLNRFRIPLLIPETLLNPQQLGAAAWDVVNEICSAWPRIPVVILEPRYNSASILMTLMRRHRNLHATMPLFGLFRQVENMARTVGADRLLFSSGLPHLDPSVPIGMLETSTLPEADAARIAGGNLTRLLAEAGREN